MESNLTFFSLPFVDDFNKIKGQECGLEEFHPGLGGHGSLLGADDVLAQFLSGDEPLEEPDLNGPTTLHCEICRKQFDNAKKYYGHLRVHSKDNLWTCDKCPNERFSTKQQLMKHTLMHKPLERVWKCPQCEMSFEALWRLQQHLFAKHLGYRPHKCDQCNKAFHKLSDLKKHKDSHDDVKRHKCTVCEAKFKDKSNLKRHMLTHDNVRPFACPGCGNRFKQVASMRRHAQNCALVTNQMGGNKNKEANLKSTTIMETEIRTNPTIPELPKENQLHVGNCTVDKIVDDILSAEDDYNMQQNQMLNYPAETHVESDSLMQTELLKEMNHMHILDDEFLYNDIDFDSFQTMYNIDGTDRNELFDINENRSIDQDLMNALYQSKGELPDLLNAPEILPKEDFLNPECATIFESDVDLEASSNLAANLNQLIGENSVQYISTEHDDTFIISLNSEIDAEQLTDMLNIGLNATENKNQEPLIPEFDNIEQVNEPIVVKIEEPVEDTSDHKEKKKTKKSVLYYCRKCNKVFNKKDNYKCHRATHEPNLRFHKCRICKERFSYKSTLNKHMRKLHLPLVLTPHTCDICDKNYKAAWLGNIFISCFDKCICKETFSYKSTLNKHMRKLHLPLVLTPHTCDICDKNYKTAWLLKRHKERDHELRQPFPCDYKGCGRKFYTNNDLIVHQRVHTGERPYSCEKCTRSFQYLSHYRRHTRKQCRKPKNAVPTIYTKTGS